MEQQPKIRADLDFDIVAHLGYVKNVDLLTKGVYMVQIKLFYGMNGKTVAPVGMFSSPSSLQSEVQGQMLPQTPICSMCEVDDVSRTFRTRSFVVRYKDEKHELNDGVHWRLTVPSTQLSKIDVEGSSIDQLGPHCSELLHLKFDLLFAAFAPEDPSQPKADLMSEIDRLVPSDPVFTVVATQNLVIENASSGIHSYYPVHFNGSYITELDCMIHCALTGIRYPSLLPKVPQVEPLRLDAFSPTSDATESNVNHSNPGLKSEDTAGSDLSVAASTPQKDRSVGETLPATPNLSTRVLPRTPLEPTPALGSIREDSIDGEYVTPSKASTTTTTSHNGTSTSTTASKRYVPMLSPHSTRMETPTGGAMDGTSNQPVGAGAGGAMHRISGRLSTWRKSVSAIASPVPLMEKVGTMGANGSRRLSMLSSALTSPIAEAASRFRAEHQGTGDRTNQDEDTHKENPLAAAFATAEEASPASTEKLAALDLSAELNASDLAVAVEQDSEVFKEDSLLDTLAARAEQLEAAEVLADQFDPLMHPDRWITLYASHVMENYAAAQQGMSFILNLYQHLQNSEEGGSVEQTALQEHCILESNAEQILVEVQECLDVTERLAILKEKLDLCNLQLTLHWSLLMTALRRVMTKLCPVLKTQYFEASKRFWRGQLLVHTKSIVQTTSYQSAEINQLLGIMGSQIKSEVNSKLKSPSSTEARAGSTVSSPDGVVVTAAARDDSNCLWRGLQIYDADLHTNVSKLPHMILQQYVGDTKAKPSLAELNARLALHHSQKSEPDEFPPHCALAEAVKAVKALNSASESSRHGDAAQPAGSVFLARGGLLLDELRRLKPHAEVEEGEVVDLSLYPVLRPILSGSFSSPKAPAVVAEPLPPMSPMRPDPSSSIHDSTASEGDTEMGLEESPHVGIVRSNSTTSSAKSSTSSSRSSAKLNWADFSSTLTPTLPAGAVASPTLARVGKLATAVPPTHLVVLQHGFLGQSYDMQLIENAIRLEFPGRIETFVARSSEGREQDSIAQMGKRLAFEVVNYCKEHHPLLLRPGSKTKLSFIGHSMGGLIVRQALQEGNMKPLLQNLHVYVSLATPHVGSLFPDSQIVSTGMWALFKWKKYKALKELVLEDSIGGKAHKSLLYKLSENGVLTYFHKLILVSSPRDQYVPVYSARVQTGHKSEGGSALGSTVAEMVNNLLTPLRADQVVRLTMDNNVGAAVDVNTLIGRTAHICYLENPIAAALLVHTISAYFE